MDSALIFQLLKKFLADSNINFIYTLRVFIIEKLSRATQKIAN